VFSDEKSSAQHIVQLKEKYAKMKKECQKRFVEKKLSALDVECLNKTYKLKIENLEHMYESWMKNIMI
jgi:hypothetical protein